MEPPKLVEAGLPLRHWESPDDTASRRVAEKAGFVLTGTVRADLDHRGRRVGAWVGSLLPGELVR